jgi:lipopolysaccharide transport system permease protein/teichoic acid transport system permease protein
VFGLSWAIIEPLAMMIILWFVFTFLRAGRDMAYPFSVFLLTGLIAYDFFNKTINSATRSIKAFSFLITKVNFRLAVVPLVKIACEVLIHLIILFIVIIILFATGQKFSVYWFQVFYYLFCSVFLLIGISWFTSSVLLFFPDITYIITIIMRVLFFMTPIFWTIDRFPPKYLIIVQLNPLFYLVNGYRDSFLVHKGFWEYPLLTVYFWGITISMLVIGVVVFRKLRPAFADII